jgi:hypothetical protein
MHFCADEVMAIAAALPFLGAGVAWLRARLAKVFSPPTKILVDDDTSRS